VISFTKITIPKKEIQMTKKCLLALALVLFVAGGAFAQTDSETMPKNTVTVDFGPTIAGAAIGALGTLMEDDADGLSSPGFGIAAQYERQILKLLSAAGRFAYLGGGLGFVEKEGGLRAELKMNIYSFSIEGHVRLYPFGRRTFFLDGMLGYAYMSTTFSGEVIVDGIKESASFTASRNYFKYGAKLGWRIDFGKPGGFTFEPSLGWYGGAGGGDTIGKQLNNAVGSEVDGLDEMFSAFENFIFIGGPRLALSFGWRF